MFRFLVLIASLVAAAHAFSDGAPVGVCEDLTPKHPADPQTGTPPYKISISKDTINAGEEVEVTLEGKDGEKFAGFLLQGRVDKTIVGSFDVDPNDPEVQTLDCPKGKKNAVTHRNSERKSKITAKWIAPKDLRDKVNFVVTFVKDGLHFWINHQSSTLTVRP